MYGAFFEDNPKGITQVARDFEVPVKVLFGLTTGRTCEGGCQAKERQEKEEQRLLEISRMQEKGATVKVKPAHRAKQITDKGTGGKKATDTAPKTKPKGGPKPGTSTETQ